MNRRAIAAIACSTLLLFAFNTAAVEPDKRVRAALDAESLNFDIDEDGDYKVVLSFHDDNDRTQQVIVQSQTFTYQQTEFREIFSAAVKLDDAGKLDLALARRLLEESSESMLGFWGIEDNVIWAIARIPANAPASALHESISFVAIRADDLEKERQGGDDF